MIYQSSPRSGEIQHLSCCLAFTSTLTITLVATNILRDGSLPGRSVPRPPPNTRPIISAPYSYDYVPNNSLPMTISEHYPYHLSPNLRCLTLCPHFLSFEYLCPMRTLIQWLFSSPPSCPVSGVVSVFKPWVSGTYRDLEDIIQPYKYTKR